MNKKSCTSKKSGRNSLERAVKSSSCYILITCSPPSANGDMQVKMTYRGDSGLAAYLLQGAQLLIDQNEDE
jgi:hypothetical protein